MALDDPRLRALAAEEIALRLHGVPEAVARPLVEAQLRSKLGALAAEHPDALAELALADGMPVGYLVTAQREGELRLCDIAVALSARGTGIGRRLLAAVRERADAEGRAVTLSVWHDAPAREWYERHGFTAYGGDPQGHLEMRRDADAGEYPRIHSVA